MNTQPILNDEFLMVSSLSIEGCLARIKAMANRDLKVEVHAQSHAHAEVQLTERRNDDLPMFVIIRLRAVVDGTSVALNRGSHPNKKLDVTVNLTPKTQEKLLKIGIQLVSMVVMGIVISRLEYVILPLLCFVPVGMFILAIDLDSTVEIAPAVRQHRIHRMMDDRYEILKADLCKVLPIAMTNAKHIHKVMEAFTG